MNERKISFGVRIDGKLLKELDKIVIDSKYLNASRSEIVETILTAYFKADINHGEKVRGLIIEKRKRLL